MITPGKLVIATHNRGKFDEFRAILEPKGFSLSCNADHGLSEPVEDGTTLQENALIKARAACNALGVPALSDDSGMFIDALDGDPGVYTADWAETPNGRDFPMAMKKVWSKLEAQSSPSPYTASFRCCLALAFPDGTHQFFEGRLEGEIVWPPRGPEGHGFDPIFSPQGYEKSLGELPAATKNKLSHRADALAKLLEDIS